MTDKDTTTRGSWLTGKLFVALVGILLGIIGTLSTGFVSYVWSDVKGDITRQETTVTGLTTSITNLTNVTGELKTAVAALSANVENNTKAIDKMSP